MRISDWSSDVCSSDLSLLPCATIILLALAVFGILPHGWWVAAFLFNLTFTGFFLKRINRFHSIVSGKHRLLEKFSQLLRHIGDQEFEDVLLRTLREESQDAFARSEARRVGKECVSKCR